jgi:hypothetical protein
VLRQRRREDISIRRARRAAPHPARRTGTQTSHERASPHVSPTGLCRLQQAATRDPTATVVVSLRHAPRAHGRNSRATATGRASRGPTGRSLGAPPPPLSRPRPPACAGQLTTGTGTETQENGIGARPERRDARPAPAGRVSFAAESDAGAAAAMSTSVRLGGPRAPLTDGIGGAPPPGPGR